MTSFNAVNGVPASGNRFLLRDIPPGTRVELGILRGKEKLGVPITPAPLTAERALGIFESRTGLKISELSVKEADGWPSAWTGCSTGSPPSWGESTSWRPCVNLR